MIMSRILLDSSERSEKIDGNDCIRRVETTACLRQVQLSCLGPSD